MTREDVFVDVKPGMTCFYISGSYIITNVVAEGRLAVERDGRTSVPVVMLALTNMLKHCAEVREVFRYHVATTNGRSSSYCRELSLLSSGCTYSAAHGVISSKPLPSLATE